MYIKHKHPFHHTTPTKSLSCDMKAEEPKHTQLPDSDPSEFSLLGPSCAPTMTNSSPHPCNTTSFSNISAKDNNKSPPKDDVILPDMELSTGFYSPLQTKYRPQFPVIITDTEPEKVNGGYW